MKRITEVLAAVMLMTMVVFTVGCNKPEDEPNNGGGNGGGNDTHAYVDLGLPSGTLWATCNVGADYPWEYGNYYAWGETKTKTSYNWSTYTKGDEDKLTKYCSKSDKGNNGFTDKLTKLQPGDDVSTAQWGSGWCMPTKEQWEELK